MTLEESLDKKSLVERIEKLERENEKLKQKVGLEKESEERRSQKVSRRGFLKKIGLGAAGIGAATLIPSASALNIKDDNLDVYTGTDKNSIKKYFSVNQNGPVKIQNTDLKIENSTGNEVIQVPVYQDTSDLPSKNEGSIAYVKNENQLYVEDGS